MSSEETDILLATLISLLQPPIPSHTDLLNALADYDGNPEAAARSLARERGTEPTQKRKRATTDLEQWLKLSDRDASDGRSSASSAHKRTRPDSYNSQSTAANPSRQNKTPSVGHNSNPPRLVNLMSVLRDGSSSAMTAAPRLPPLLLSNPSMVAQHTPCTLHYSVLPQDLACELFYTMLDAAQGWSRNKWWLFDRLVESPHRTSFFARTEGFDAHSKDPKSEESVAEIWKEAAQFWSVLFTVPF